MTDTGRTIVVLADLDEQLVVRVPAHPSPSQRLTVDGSELARSKFLAWLHVQLDDSGHLMNDRVTSDELLAALSRSAYRIVE